MTIFDGLLLEHMQAAVPLANMGGSCICVVLSLISLSLLNSIDCPLLVRKNWFEVAHPYQSAY